MTDALRPDFTDTQIIFLGICERANYVREVNTNVFKWHILGLKTIILSHIFPLKFDGFFAGFAFLPSTDEINTKIQLVDAGEKKIGTINLFAKPESPNGEDALLKSSGPLLLVSKFNWITLFTSLKDTGWLIESPGFYYLEQVTNDKPIRIGMLQFAAVDAAPLTAERIKAIKSEPKATKAVHIELGCKHCPAKFRAYAALERSNKTEDEGWTWYQEVPETFKCNCGSTTIDLQYVKRNLHAWLGHRPRDNNQLSFIPLYEKSSLETTRTNFARLISIKPREESLQQFIDENPILLHQFPAEKIIPKPPILTAHLADFGIVTPQKELILIELEKTTTRLMTKNGDLAAPLNHAFDQVREWLYYVDEHRLAVLDSLKIERDTVSSIRGVVIAGRDVGYDARDLRKLKGVDYGRITFLTYDDLLFALDALIRRVENI